MTDPQSTPPKSSWWLAFRVLDEPGTVFAEIAARPRFLVPFLVLFAAAPAFFAVTAPDSAYQAQVEQLIAIEENQDPGSVTSERRAEMMEEAASPARRARLLAVGVIVGPIVIAIVAAVLMLIFNAMAADRITFKQEYSVILHAWMPQLFAALLVPVLAIAGIEQLQLSLGFLFSSDQSSFMYQFANGITLFGAWSMVLVAMGNQVLSKSSSLGGSLTIVAGLWLLVKVAAAGLGSLVAGLAG